MWRCYANFPESHSWDVEELELEPNPPGCKACSVPLPPMGRGRRTNVDLRMLSSSETWSLGSRGWWPLACCGSGFLAVLTARHHLSPDLPDPRSQPVTHSTLEGLMAAGRGSDREGCNGTGGSDGGSDGRRSDGGE
jgi:hypothetical protein